MHDAPPVPIPPPPAGYRYARAVPAEVTAAAVALLNSDAPWNTTRAAGVYLLRVEPHRDAASGPRPYWHRGVSVFEPASTASTTDAPASRLPTHDAPQLSDAPRAAVYTWAPLAFAVALAALVLLRRR